MEFFCWTDKTSADISIEMHCTYCATCQLVVSREHFFSFVVFKIIAYYLTYLHIQVVFDSRTYLDPVHALYKSEGLELSGLLAKSGVGC